MNNAIPRLTDFRCCLITGASSGLGMEFARQLAPRCNKLIITARRGEVLQKLADDLRHLMPNPEVVVLPCDLTVAQDREDLISGLAARNLSPDCLINNAGMGDYGEFSTSSWDKVSAMLQLNVEALTHLTHQLLPGLVSQKGAILNLSSLASVLPIPDFAVYAASKAYVTSFSEALRLELRNQRVRVLAVCPGPVKTGFGEIARRSENSNLPVKEAFYVPAEKVVADSISALLRDRPRLYPGFKVAAAATLLGILPVAVVRLIMSARPRRSE